VEERFVSHAGLLHHDPESVFFFLPLGLFSKGCPVQKWTQFGEPGVDFRAKAGDQRKHLSKTFPCREDDENWRVDFLL
jgi:hypothetical protein